MFQGLQGGASGLILGTVGYMAPEQVWGQAVDHRADIFAFGVVLFEMLTGARAFGGDSAIAVCRHYRRRSGSLAVDAGRARGDQVARPSRSFGDGYSDIATTRSDAPNVMFLSVK